MSKKWPIFAYDSTDRLREKRTRGGRGSKIPKILRTYFMDAPLGHVLINFFLPLKPSKSASKLKKLLKISFEADLPHWVTHGVVPLNANRHRQKHRPHPTHVSQSHAEKEE